MHVNEIYRNILFSLRGHINSRLLLTKGARDYNFSDAMLVFGNYRGGTTWIGELLSAIPHSAILFEPTHLVNAKKAKHAGFRTRLYISSQDSWPEGVEFFDKLLVGDNFNAWTTGEIPITSVLSIQHWVVKLIGCSTIAPWILNNFKVRKPVMIMRHPAAIFSSQLERGWKYTGINKIVDKPFFDSNPKYMNIYEQITTPEELFAMRWCIDQLSLLSLGDRVHRICFEKLQLEGVVHLEPVFDSWNISAPTALENIFNKPSAKASKNFNVEDKTVVSGWKHQLDSLVVDQIISVVEKFGIEFYNRSPDPVYEKIDNYLPEVI